MKTDSGYSLPWFRCNNDLVDHPKTLRLEEVLGDPQALAYIIRLWSWVMRHCPRGRLAPFHGTSIETACRWRGQSGALVAAFVLTGWLDSRPDGGWEVHDWPDHQGAAVAKAEKDSERKRKLRKQAARSRASGRRAVGAGNDDDDVDDDDSTYTPTPLSDRDGGAPAASMQPRGEKMGPSPASTAPPPSAVVGLNDLTAALVWVRWAFATRGHIEAESAGAEAMAVRWASDFAAKYGLDALERLKPAYEDFLSWATKDGRTPGWGLWAQESVWLPRWSDVRVGALPRQPGLALGPLGAVR